MAKKFTKADYKKHKREVKRTSKIRNKIYTEKSDIFFLTSIMPYGAFKGLTIQQIMDEHWPYYVAIEEKLRFAEEVRVYAKEISTKIKALNNSLNTRRYRNAP